jgi:hypothetical protein
MHDRLKAIRQKHKDQKNIAKADLKMYLNKQACLRSHGDPDSVIEQKLDNITVHQNVIDTINEYIHSDGLSKTLKIVEE